MGIKSIALAASTLVLSVASFNVNAAVIQYSDTLSPTFSVTWDSTTGYDPAPTALGTLTYMLPMFDSSLGNLTSVVVNVDQGYRFISGTRGYYYGNDSINMSSSATQSFNFSLGSISESANGAATTFSRTCSTGVGDSCGGGGWVGTSNYANTFSYSDTDVLDFIGTSMFQLIGNADISLTASGFNSSAYASTRFDSSDFSGSTVMVTYEYTVVPVPAAVWLFGSGLIGLIRVARRKSA